MRAATTTLFVAALALAGCDRHPAPLRRAEPVPAAARPARAPFVVTVAGPASVSAGDDAEIVVTISRTRPNAAPLELHVELPPGTSLVEGAPEERIVDDASPAVVRTLRVHLDRLPDGDALVTVVMRGATRGAVGHAAYRFGRPAPLLPSPVRAAAAAAGLGHPVIVGPTN